MSDPTKPTGVIITLQEMYAMITGIRNDTMQIRSKMNSLDKLETTVDELENKVNSLENKLTAHAVIIGIVSAVITALAIGALV